MDFLSIMASDDDTIDRFFDADDDEEAHLKSQIMEEFEREVYGAPTSQKKTNKVSANIDTFSDEEPSRNDASKKNNGSRYRGSKVTTQLYQDGRGEPRSNNRATDKRDILRSQLPELKSLIIDEFRREIDAARLQDNDNKDTGQSKKDVFSSSREEDRIFETMQDTYSIMFACEIKSQGFVYSLFFLALQVVITLLIGWNSLKKEKGAPTGNVLNVPVDTNIEVILAQVLALFVSLITQSDFIATFDLLNVHYDYGVLSVFKGATYKKWIISNVSRFLVGVSSIVISFILIIQSEEVIELFFNFAAVLFVSELDNIAFQLAHKGYIPGDLEHTTRKLIDQVQFLQREKVDIPCTKKRMPIKWLRVSIFAVHVIILYSVWGVVRYRQYDDKFLKIHLKGSCQSFQVTFDEEKTKISSKVEWFGLYGGFSDFYQLSFELEGGRPVYYQRNLKDGFGDKERYPGKFSYCKKEEAWVFTIDGFDFKGFDFDGIGIVNATSEACSSWLLRSPKTKAYTLVDTPTTGWSMWLNRELVSADPFFKFSCLDCGSKLDCSYHGECKKEEKTCSCDSPWTGRSCQIYACPVLINSSTDQENGTVTTAESFERLQEITYNDRPIYYRLGEGENKPTKLVFYSYGRFNVYERKYFKTDAEKEALLKKLSTDVGNYHDFWDNYPKSDSDLIHTFVSEYTTATMPIRTSGIESTDVTWKNDWPTKGTTIEFQCEDSSKELDTGYDIGFKYNDKNVNR